MTPADAVMEAENLDQTFEQYADMTYDQLSEIFPGQMEPKDEWVAAVVAEMENATDGRNDTR